MVPKGVANPMPRVVVILPSTTYRAGDFVKAAEALGVDLVVASEQPPPLDMGDGYLQIDCSNPDASAEAVIRLGDDVHLDGVVAADDRGVVIAAMAGSRLGLPTNDPGAAASTRDKATMRDRLAASEVPQPEYRRLTVHDDAKGLAKDLGYPLVVKPISRSASQGVLRVDESSDLDPTIRRVRAIAGDEDLLLEQYMPGLEVAVEGLVRNGELTVLAVFDKPDASAGPSFPETILVTPSRMGEVAIAECVRVAELAIAGLGLSHGPVHIELKVDRHQVRVIEVAARSIGGLCSRSLSFGLMDTTLETLILRNALMMDKPELRRRPQASGVLMIPIDTAGTLRSVLGVEETAAIEGITGIELTIPPGTRVRPVPDGDRYLGFVFARAPDPQSVETALRKAKDLIQPLIEQP